jgi:hypothetical protein
MAHPIDQFQKSHRVGGLVAPGGTSETCTKWRTDYCNGCDVYCCEGTTLNDIGVLAIEDDK